ncbi:hypothetical protein DFO50_108124 [Microvirgula sp. AG722]|uniref:hypothetical protein n=1 Tax=Microvirgula sp. AG722 TaxID=2183901 RepID=UPI000DC358DE|nr:hypothetical protein [Microvirgula sp. AG722]RAS15055.1 hypothetical protein DFO50_108124 [Microvirgula sp. AG722]
MPFASECVLRNGGSVTVTETGEVHAQGNTTISVATGAGGVEITARHDAEGRSDFINQTASVKGRMPF